jgi:hypothetical protein
MMGTAERRMPMAGGTLPAAVRRGGLVLGALALALVTASCGGGKAPGKAAPPASASTKPLASCGTTKTAANVPVNVEVRRGKVGCDEAMSIEKKYATAIESGKEPGNGGGGPVDVDGWTCRGFATPVVLRTGNASKCEKDGDVILAVLPTTA